MQAVIPLTWVLLSLSRCEIWECRALEGRKGPRRLIYGIPPGNIPVCRWRRYSSAAVSASRDTHFSERCCLGSCDVGGEKHNGRRHPKRKGWAQGMGMQRDPARRVRPAAYICLGFHSRVHNVVVAAAVLLPPRLVNRQLLDALVRQQCQNHAPNSRGDFSGAVVKSLASGWRELERARENSGNQ